MATVRKTCGNTSQLLKMAIEIVDFPINSMVDLSIVMLIYQTAYSFSPGERYKMFLDVSSVLVCQAIRWSNLLSLMISHELQGGSLWPLCASCSWSSMSFCCCSSILSFTSPKKGVVGTRKIPIPSTTAAAGRSRLKDYKISWYKYIQKSHYIYQIPTDTH